MSLIGSVGNNLKNFPTDVSLVKRILESLNILSLADDPIPDGGIMTGRIRDGIKTFQRDHNLPVTGDIHEGSDTAKKINEIHLRSSGEVYGPPEMYGPPASSQSIEMPPIPQHVFLPMICAHVFLM